MDIIIYIIIGILVYLFIITPIIGAFIPLQYGLKKLMLKHISERVSKEFVLTRLRPAVTEIAAMISYMSNNSIEAKSKGRLYRRRIACESALSVSNEIIEYLLRDNNCTVIETLKKYNITFKSYQTFRIKELYRISKDLNRIAKEIATDITNAYRVCFFDTIHHDRFTCKLRYPREFSKDLYILGFTTSSCMLFAKYDFKISEIYKETILTIVLYLVYQSDYIEVLKIVSNCRFLTDKERKEISRGNHDAILIYMAINKKIDAMADDPILLDAIALRQELGPSNIELSEAISQLTIKKHIKSRYQISDL